MSSAAIRDLKNNLSRYVRQIESGKRIAVTANGRVVAELVPPSGGARRGSARRYDELVAAGVIEPCPRARFGSSKLARNWRTGRHRRGLDRERPWRSVEEGTQLAGRRLPLPSQTQDSATSNRAPYKLSHRGSITNCPQPVSYESCRRQPEGGTKAV